MASWLTPAHLRSAIRQGEAQPCATVHPHTATRRQQWLAMPGPHAHTSTPKHDTQCQATAKDLTVGARLRCLRNGRGWHSRFTLPCPCTTVPRTLRLPHCACEALTAGPWQGAGCVRVRSAVTAACRVCACWRWWGTGCSMERYSPKLVGLLYSRFSGFTPGAYFPWYLGGRPISYSWRWGAACELLGPAHFVARSC